MTLLSIFENLEESLVKRKILLLKALIVAIMLAFGLALAYSWYIFDAYSLKIWLYADIFGLSLLILIYTILVVQLNL